MMFLLFLLAGIGLTSIIVDSEFFAGPKARLLERIQKRAEELGEEASKDDKKLNRLRKLNYLLNCYQCSGFWVGLLLGLLIHPCGGYFPHVWRLLEAVLCAGAISFVAPMGMALYSYFNVQYGPPQQ